MVSSTSGSYHQIILNNQEWWQKLVLYGNIRNASNQWYKHATLAEEFYIWLPMAYDWSIMPYVGWLHLNSFIWKKIQNLYNWFSNGFFKHPYIVIPLMGLSCNIIEMRRLTHCGVSSRFGVLDCVRIEEADWTLITLITLCSWLWLWLSCSFEIPTSLCPESWAKQTLSPLSCFCQGIFSQQLEKKLICVRYYPKLITDMTNSQ